MWPKMPASCQIENFFSFEIDQNVLIRTSLLSDPKFFCYENIDCCGKNKAYMLTVRRPYYENRALSEVLWVPQLSYELYHCWIYAAIKHNVGYTITDKSLSSWMGGEATCIVVYTLFKFIVYIAKFLADFKHIFFKCRRLKMKPAWRRSCFKHNVSNSSFFYYLV